jgi:hypothetical protein
MDAEQMDLLERLARLRELGAISRREFSREKATILRALPHSVPVLRALPAPGAPGAAAATALSARAALQELEVGGVARAGRIAGWLLWTAFSVGGLDALIGRDPLLALALLVSGLFFSPPLQRLLATRMGPTARLTLTAAGVLAALGIVTAAPGRATASARRSNEADAAAAACSEFVSGAVGARGEVAREGIARPWRKVWSDLLWARVAGSSLYAEWRSDRG